MFDTLITGGKVVDGSGLPWYQADVATRGDRIAAIGQLAHADAKLRIDAAGKVVAPGFIDAQEMNCRVSDRISLPYLSSDR